MSENNIQDEFEPRFLIDKRGNWFQDGIKIRHRLTYLYNNKLLDRDEEGRYFVDEGSGRLYIQVEDTPFVVKMIHKKDDGYHLILNDETQELMDFDSLTINNENIPYVKIKDGKFDARFLRPAYYELMKYLIKEGNRYYIDNGNRKQLLKRHS